ncbi:uncharacterized protein LOC143271732, partial [Peromyscus maniculatus bairdii]|uniref:uncharacterized protein LOC143271732 n=1 Tax=Peromyscus maniculatus bairdii TaxID=230844 RepID=UPI003FD458AB
CSTRAGHREQRARVPRHPTRSDRIPRPQPRGEISGNMATEHVNGNGTEEPMDTTSAVIHSENFQTLLDAGLPQKVAEKLDEIYVAGLVAHSDLDERAIEALKEFNEDGALAVLQQFKDSDLSHVQNKSAFLCGVMKTYRQREKQGTKVADSSKGPDEAKIKALLERTGYTLDVTTGQRKYGGPPPDSVYSGQQPSVGTEIFVGKIPRDLFEDELVPLFEKAGPIWDLRLMMDPLTSLNRGNKIFGGRGLRASGTPSKVGCTGLPERAPSCFGPCRLPPSAAVTCLRSRARRCCHFAAVPASSVRNNVSCGLPAAAAPPRSSTGARPPARPALASRRGPGEAAWAPPRLRRAGCFPCGPGSAEPHGHPGGKTGVGAGAGASAGAGGGERAGAGAGAGPSVPPGASPSGPSRFCPGPAACADPACLGSTFPHREI